MYWLINSLKVYKSDNNAGLPAAIPMPRIGLALAKNETLPLLTSPLAMGGGLPVRGERGGVGMG